MIDKLGRSAIASNTGGRILDQDPKIDRIAIWPRLGALALVVAALGLPLNDLFRYGLLLFAAIVIVSSPLSLRVRSWLTAACVVAVVAVGQIILHSPRIEEGHNVFLPERQGAVLETGLPGDVFRYMKERFDAQYPVERRCDPKQGGCWRAHAGPEQTFAFSADAVFDQPSYSRRVTDIDFSNAVWLRLGFINQQYNWYTGQTDVERSIRLRRFARLGNPWRVAMPFFVMYQFPAEFVGSHLCWQGDVLWEGAGERFTAWPHATMACRVIEARDVGQRIFGVSIASDAPLLMKLEPTIWIQLRQTIGPVLAFVGAMAVLMLLVRWDRRRLLLPLSFVAAALLVILLNDASFLGGVRPFDGGDDGLFYESTGRKIARHVLAGHYMLALQGEEKVFYYGGPGLRYLRALERFIFGESFLGYVTALLVMPFVFFAAFRRFLGARTALVLTLGFVLLPIGALFGTSFFQYVRWAERGFADPAAAIAFLGGLVILVGPTAAGPNTRFGPACGAGLLFALALFLRPNLASGAAVLLGGAGLYSLWHMEVRRLAGLCLGFLPVFSMALHNWYFGGVFVLFSSNATIPEALPMPPSAYVAAFGELLRLDVTGEHVRRGLLQIGRWLSGPSEARVMVPLHAAAIAVLVRVCFACRYEGWIRLIAGAALALHPVALFYLSYDRYYYLAWLITMLVTCVWVRDDFLPYARQRFPKAVERAMYHPLTQRFLRLLERLELAVGLGLWAKRA
jgi:hypothetical protein